MYRERAISLATYKDSYLIKQLNEYLSKVKHKDDIFEIVNNMAITDTGYIYCFYLEDLKKVK